MNERFPSSMTPRKRKVKGSSPKSKVKKILARWSDGLFYVIKILKVSEMKKRCLVEFEDQSTAYVHFKDLLDEHKEETKTCHNCGGEDELENNAFIRCTNCDRDYHRHCHVPPIISDPMAKQFVCRICVFAACAKAGGAKDTGPMAARFMFMKREFPYDLEHLSWNPSHTSNTSECYCYCGGPGNFFNKMLQCCRCQQWFHEACVQCINGGVLMGDRFYIFACAHCNYGEEFLKRLELSWQNIVYIAIFHLIMTQGLKYTDLDTDIIPFLKEHADNFQLNHVLNVRSLDAAFLKEKVLDVVTCQTDVYCCGAKVKKKHSLYGLRERIPPPPPSFYIPYQAEKISNLTLANSLGKRALFKPPKYLNPVPYLIRGANKFIPSTMSLKLREASMARLRSEHNYCSTSDEHSSSSDSAFSKESFDANNNNSPFRHTPVVVKTEVIDDDDDTDDDYSNQSEACHDPVQRVCPVSLPPQDETELEESGEATNSVETAEKTEFWSLDTAFPEPSDFTGINNPFLTEFELEDLKAQRQHFVEHLDYLSQNLRNSFPKESCSEEPASPPSGLSPVAVPNGVLKNIKGFKGELAKIFKTNGFAASSSVKAKDLNHKQSISYTTPEKISSASGCSPKRGRSSNASSQGSFDSSEKSRNSRSVDSTVINGIKLSPQLKSKLLNKNGYKHNHRYSNSHETNQEEKRLDAVSRCLKNLIPTCGFHFPVLDENHPSVVNGYSIEDSLSSDSAKSHNLGRRGLKRKHLSHNRGRSSQRLCYDLQENNNKTNNGQSSSESVRRSHRSRQTVKRFETADVERSNSLSLHSDAQVNSSILSSAKYNVISLRAKHDNTVDYLISWCE